MNRDFKGVWIPKEIWLATNLGWSAKLLLVEINSLESNGKCFATNEYFANFFGLSKDRISKLISELKNKGYIEIAMLYKPGTKQIEKRVITTRGYRRKQLEGIGENNDTPIGENNEDSNTDNINTINNTGKEINKETTPIGDNKKNPPPQKREEEIVSIYRDICKSYPEIIEITETRRKNMQFLLSKLDISKIRKAFEKAENTPFLKGKNKRNWIANFDFLIDYNNIVKLLEGFYDTYQQGFQHSRKPSYDIEEYERHSIFDDEDLNTF